MPPNPRPIITVQSQATKLRVSVSVMCAWAVYLYTALVTARRSRSPLPHTLQILNIRDPLHKDQYPESLAITWTQTAVQLPSKMGHSFMSHSTNCPDRGALEIQGHGRRYLPGAPRAWRRPTSPPTSYSNPFSSVNSSRHWQSNNLCENI